MRLMIRLLPMLVLVFCGASSARAEIAAGTEADPGTGLIVADGWELVAANCSACHSLRLVTAQRGDADFWREIIRWMQRTQNLWQIPAQQEVLLIEYLATHYNETEWGRREPLAASLLPAPR